MTHEFRQIYESPVAVADLDKEDEHIEANRRYRESLKEGYWLQISERYMTRGRWTPERVARDGWQNFFDANGQTLDGIDFRTETEDGQSTIVISGDVQGYDFTRLIAFGVGHKPDEERSAGGEGEGTRIMALHMLRDLDFTEVKFGADDWELEFYLAKPPAGKVPIDQKDFDNLFVRLKDKDPKTGNYVRFTSTNQAMIEEFVKARDLFRHSGNQDFKDPDIETKQAGMVVHKDRKGNFYLNGQRIAYDGEDSWETLPDFTFWSNSIPIINGQQIHVGRDRRSVSWSQLEKIYLPFLVDSMDQNELQLALLLLEPFFEKKKYPSLKDEGKRILELVVQRLSSEFQYKHNFDDQWVACDVSDEVEDVLRDRLNYKICNSCLAKVGMKKASQEWKIIGKMNVVENKDLLPGERERMLLLEGFMRRLLEDTESVVESLLAKAGDPSVLKGRLEPKPIILFNTTHPLAGQYEQGKVFVSRGEIRKPGISGPLATYKHELCHKFGADNSVGFSYALTDLDERQISFLINNPMALKDLNDSWQRVEIKESDEDNVWEFYELEDAVLALPPIEYQWSGIRLPHPYETLLTGHEDLKRLVLTKCGGHLSFENFMFLRQCIAEQPEVVSYRQSLTQMAAMQEKNQSDISARERERNETWKRIEVLRRDVQVLAREKMTQKRRRQKDVYQKRIESIVTEIQKLEKDFRQLATEISALSGEGFMLARRRLEQVTLLDVPYVNIGNLCNDLDLVLASWRFFSGQLKREKMILGSVADSFAKIVEFSKITERQKGLTNHWLRLELVRIYEELAKKRGELKVKLWPQLSYAKLLFTNLSLD